MPNVPKPLNIARDVGEDAARFIDSFGLQWEEFGAGAIGGRLFALLLLSGRPLSLDELVDQLGASKSSLSVAARHLLQFGLVRRIGVRGSRRVLYEAADSFDSLLEAELRQRVTFLERVRQAETYAESRIAKRRVRRLAALFEHQIASGRRALATWQQTQPKA